MKKLLIAASCIVKNESDCIERMLNSIKDLVDAYVIVDTGSTDNTIEIIKNFCVLNNKVLKISQMPFINFGVCRNAALKQSKELSDYSMWIDADEYLIYEDLEYVKDLRNLLKSKKYSSVNIQCSYNFNNYVYWRKNIVNNSFVWVGKVHEYLQSVEDNSCVYVNEIKIQLTPEGNSHKKTNKEKFSFYCDLLKEDWEQTKDSRWLFYLAQSYQDMGDFKNALYYYNLRCSEQGYLEERYISCLRSSRILKSLNSFEWINKSLECSLYDNCRIEHLYDLGFYYYENKKYEISIIFLKECLEKIKHFDVLNEKFLFIEGTIYSYKVFDLLYVIAFLLKEENLLRECYFLLKKSLKDIQDKKELDRITNNLKLNGK